MNRSRGPERATTSRQHQHGTRLAWLCSAWAPPSPGSGPGRGGGEEVIYGFRLESKDGRKDKASEWPYWLEAHNFPFNSTIWLQYYQNVSTALPTSVGSVQCVVCSAIQYARFVHSSTVLTWGQSWNAAVI
jgi:hypothetical protein